MRLGKKIKRDTQLIIISVLILTLVTMSVSYSAFFSVQSQSTVQEISTGTLNVLIDGSSAMSGDDLFPTSSSDLPSSSTSVINSSCAKLNLSNVGSLDADFSVTLGYDALPSGKTSEDLISLKYLNVGIFDLDNNAWINFGDETNEVYHTPITGLTPSKENTYPILRDTVYSEISNANDASKKSMRQYCVYVWLAENTPITEIGKLVYLKLDVKSATVNGKVES